MDIPQDILDLVNSLKTKHLNFDRDEKVRKKQRVARGKQVKSARLKANIENAKIVFEWAEVLYNSTVGKILMQESHPPTAYKNIFFFDGHVQDKDWVGFLIEDGKGLCLSDGGKFALHTRLTITSAKHLAVSVDPEILSEVVKWIEDGRVWDCIKRRFKRER